MNLRMHLDPIRKGEMYIFFEAALWGLFPVITILTYSQLPPLFSAGIGSLIAAVFFAGIVTTRGRWHQFGRTTPWKEILTASVLIGFFFYSFLFVGLKHTTAGNGSIVLLMEVFSSFVLLGFLLKHEPLIPVQMLGAACMVMGSLFILLPKASGWHSGDVLILIGTLFPPLGNRCIQQARLRISTECMMFVRSMVSGCLLLLLAWFTEPMPDGRTLHASLGFLLINGLLLLGYSKILWIEGIRFIPITKAISIASIAPLCTLIFASLFLHERVTTHQIFALIPMIAGVYLLTRRQKN